MALVVLLRGVNVGGHKTFRPALLADQLKQFDVVNIGAAGTFVARGPVTQARLRAELARRLPFETEIIICRGRELLDFISRDPFAGQPVGPNVVRFVNVLSRIPRSEPSMPVSLPSSGQWLVRIIGRQGRFMYGIYRRHMKTIGHLGKVDRLFDVSMTSRNWNTITAIAGVAERGKR
jgi:uncharacterized protein (DUF1697 family)